MPDSAPFRFDQVIDRSATNSMKWTMAQRLLTPAQAAAQPLPMWVADMDLRAPDAVIDALREMVSFGVFGYPAGPTPGYLQAVTGWQARRFGWEVDAQWVVPTAGVITALKTAIQAFSAPGDSVLIQPPVYGHFHDDTVLNGRRVSAAPLRLEDGRYRFDPAVFESAIRDDTRLFILSNPHNPTGNVWTADELRTMGEICLRHGVLVVSDEIHQDFVLAQSLRHVPFASLGPRFASHSLTCTSASKTFNLAGLQCANVFIADRRLRGEFTRQLQRNQFHLVNLPGMVATEAAYAHGEPWLRALLQTIGANQRHFADTINAADWGLRVHAMDSLYLAWVDCRGLGLTAEQIEDLLLRRARVWFDKGRKFGAEGQGFMRANLGCPRAVVDEALARLAQGLGGGAQRQP